MRTTFGRVNYPFLFDGINNYYGDICRYSNTAEIHGFIGTLYDCVECYVSQEIHGVFDLTMRYPLYGAFSDKIQVKNIIGAIIPCPTFRGATNVAYTRQFFRIAETKRSDNFTIEVIAHHISYELSWIPVIPFETTTNSIDNVISIINNSSVAVPSNPFTIYSGGTFENKTFDFQGVYSLKKYLCSMDGSVADVFGGEWVFDNLNIEIVNRLGKDRGIHISKGNNLVSFSDTQNIDETFDDVLAFCKKSDGTILTANTTGRHTPPDGARLNILDFSNQFPGDSWTDIEIQNRMVELATQYINDNNSENPKNDFAATYTNTPESVFGDINGNGNIIESVFLGDTLHVSYDNENEVIVRVNRIKYDVLGGRNAQVEVASPTSNKKKTQTLASTISNLETTTSEVVREIIDNSSSGGSSSDEFERAYRILAAGDYGS